MQSRDIKLVEASTAEALESQLIEMRKSGWIQLAERPQSAAAYAVTMVRDVESE